MNVSPNVLEFKGDFTKPTTEYLTLTNTAEYPLAFKVKTTAPKLYCVRPNASVVEPGDQVKISIILQGFTQSLPSDYKCKDKFLIVSLPCPDLKDASKVSENWTLLEGKYKSQMESKKLRVNYIITGDEGELVGANGYGHNLDASNGVGGAAIAGIASSSQIDKNKNPSELQKELDASSSKIDSLSQKLDSNEKESDSAVPKTGGKSDELVSVPFALVLILLAFFLGYLIF